jgi:predicted SPOUT superfamily RNA methylase MTH1
LYNLPLDLALSNHSAPHLSRALRLQPHKPFEQAKHGALRDGAVIKDPGLTIFLNFVGLGLHTVENAINLISLQNLVLVRLENLEHKLVKKDPLRAEKPRVKVAHFFEGNN